MAVHSGLVVIAALVVSVYDPLSCYFHVCGYGTPRHCPPPPS